MKLNEFLIMNELKLEISVTYNGKYCCDFIPRVEIKEGIFVKGAWGESSENITTAIINTIKNISNQTIKINNERYVKVLNLEL